MSVAANEHSPHDAAGLGHLPWGGKSMSERVRDFDWANHPLGPQENWPQSLKTAVRIMLTSRFAMWMGWGKDLTFFYNDAYGPTLGIKQEWALGAPATEVWQEIWSEIGPRARSVIETGEATWDESLRLFLERRGFPEETYHTFSYSPIPDDSGATGGMLCVVTEETERVIGERRLALLRDVAAELSMAKTEEEWCQAVPLALSRNSRDLPFAMIYLFEEDGTTARLAVAHGVEPESGIAPFRLEIDDEGGWPVKSFLAGSRTVKNLDQRFEAIPCGPWDVAPRMATGLPLAGQGQEGPAGFLIAGINPYRPHDEAYRGFVEVLAGQIAAALTSVRAYEQERERARRLAELDLAKTTFFSNVSHEFRTPLTLMLGPVENALQELDAGGPPALRRDLEVVRRNSLRLLKLVNALLDFSRIEGGRVNAVFEPVDLAALTTDLASNFRSAIERAGMYLAVDCPPLGELVMVDQDMWEKVVLNLLSNAFKHTLKGGIAVILREAENSVELVIKDTGTGIPAEALPHLFERFFRVPGSIGRTHEGTGIGLALVQELVKLHGGSIQVESQPGAGSAFTVRLPRGCAHLPAASLHPARARPRTPSGAGFVEEALGWTQDVRDEDSAGSSPADCKLGRIVLADDNADMRDYVGGLLGREYELEVVADGAAALAAARRQRPDLVLTDVMMPVLDGFGLLKELRADPGLHNLPVIMLSARAGEESRIEGHVAGADDYLVKPFSGRELLARVSANIRLSRERRDNARRVEQILDSISDAFVSIDDKWNFLYANRSYMELVAPLYASADELLGHSLWELFPDIVGSPVARFYERCMVEQKPGVFELHYEPLHRWLEVHAHPSPAMLSLYIRDVTARKLDEAALQEAKEAAEAASRAKDRFLAVLSHELRTPLTPVLMMATAHEADPALPEDLRNDMTMIRRNLELETKLIDDLLDLNRITSGKLSLRLEPVDLCELVRHVCAICRPQVLQKSIRLETHLEHGPALVRADSARLQQVLWNLLHNAVKFTPERGLIDIRTHTADPHHLEIQVRDSGEGIHPELLPRIFDAFEQGDARITRLFGGLGLGLAISRALVELHGGAISAQSAGPGKGSTFTVVLPVESPAAQGAVPELPASAALDAHQLRLLVVEDHADTARALGILLRRAGFAVSSAGNVHAALEVLEKEPVDLIVSDLGLPDGTGYDLMRRVRETRPIPGIAMSGYGMEEDIQRSREAGFSEHLVKPVNVSKLEQAIRRVMQGR